MHLLTHDPIVEYHVLIAKATHAPVLAQYLKKAFGGIGLILQMLFKPIGTISQAAILNFSELDIRLESLATGRKTKNRYLAHYSQGFSYH